MPKICEVGGADAGLIFPLGGDDEAEWPQALKVVLYFFGLMWCFLGVAIISDVFMGAIETITSRRRRILNAQSGKFATVKVWNDTVANLTLMALGSSAPEILLSLIELFKNNFYSGELGPSTIVGSAAFNLFVITAVCVCAIPPGETRHIKDTSVFAVTAACSIFAYLWLLFIISGTSPDRVDLWESITCFMFFPALVFVAYLADIGTFSSREGAVTSRIAAGDLSDEELAKCEMKIRLQHGKDLAPEQVMMLVEREHAPQKTRATYRVGAIRGLLAGRRVLPELELDTRFNVTPALGTCDDTLELVKHTAAVIQFAAHRYAVLESVGLVKVAVTRTGDLDKIATVNYKTREGTAKEKADYEPVEGVLQFDPGEESKYISVRIIDDTAYEDEEEFYLDLFDPCCTSSGKAVLGDPASAAVVIIDDDDPGVIMFEQEHVTIQEQGAEFIACINLMRRHGSNGSISCEYTTQDDSAVAGIDYEASSGTVCLENGQMTAAIEVPIKPSGRYMSKETFRVVLSKPSGGARFDHTTDGGVELNICTVDIEATKLAKDRVESLAILIRSKTKHAQIGNANWRDQFISAFWVNGSREEQAESSRLDCFMHILTFPWKMIFALVPPTDYVGGWVCFVTSLAMIGAVTALIGDLALLFGCAFGFPDSITAITFVALGTSLPDTFASKAAAEQDPYADASIGNVVGSNSVNVFLGLGLPWTIAAIYWKIQGPTEDWAAVNPAGLVLRYPEGGFIVEAGGLGFSVTVFSICAMACIGVLTLRRKLYGGELGGPQGPKYATAVFLCFLWFLYLSCSAWYAFAF